MKQLINYPDANNAETFVIEQSNWIDARVLIASAPVSHVVPEGAKFVLFDGTGDYWVKMDGTAIITVADILDGSGSEINPLARIVKGATTIGLVADETVIVTMAFYQ